MKFTKVKKGDVKRFRNESKTGAGIMDTAGLTEDGSQKYEMNAMDWEKFSDKKQAEKYAEAKKSQGYIVEGFELISNTGAPSEYLVEIGE